jgi:hypothetical protein
MDTIEFKRKLDNREFWGENSKEMWQAARVWEIESNNEDSIIKWSWDCGLKLDYDGDVCSISSRFYPPHKNSMGSANYSGTICLLVGDAAEYLHEHEVEAESLDSLKSIVENYVEELLGEIHEAIRKALTQKGDSKR